MRKTCSNCRFWSEMCARSIGGGPMEALCLADGPQPGKYTTQGQYCPAWKSNHFGAIDSPPNYGEHTRAAYEAEDGAP